MFCQPKPHTPIALPQMQICIKHRQMWG